LVSILAWPARRWLAATVAAVTFAVVAGGLTAVVQNPFTHRVVPASWWTYVTLAISAVLGGLVTATYVRSSASLASPTSNSVGKGRVAGGGLLSVLAIGCPVCNKLVVLAVGASGALSLWAPIQPVLAVASIGLLAWALRTRLAGELSCPVPAPDARERSMSRLSTRRRGFAVVLWIAQVLLALFFVVAATPKFIGTRQAVEQVAMLGFGDWFRYLIGLCEMAGAIGLLIRPLAGLAAAGLAVVMFLAMLADLFVLPNPWTLPASLCLACALLAWTRRVETRAVLDRIRY
jgi:hypothetical protein